MEEKTTGKVPETLGELLVGIVVSGIVFQSTVIWLTKNKAAYSAGLWIGVLLAGLLAWHMWKTLSEALESGEAQAQKMMRKQSLLRYGIVVFVLAGLMLMYNGSVNPLAAFLGIMTLKTGAYLQPLTHRVIQRLRR